MNPRCVCFSMGPFVAPSFQDESILDTCITNVNMQLSAEQEEAVSKFSSGHNVCVKAVPGAGKSRVLVETCRRVSQGLSIIIAYNRDLCEETCAKLRDANLSDRVLCYTFHGLCCACLQLLSFWKTKTVETYRCC